MRAAFFHACRQSRGASSGSARLPYRPFPYGLFISAARRATGRLGWLRGALGAGLGIALAATAAHFVPGPGGPWLLAPLGASAVLVFALPASPLAQPWSVLGGNLLSALVGLGMAALFPSPWIAAPLAVAVAIAVMSLCRCLHPPGGACALLAALGGPAVAAHGPAGLVLALAVNVAALLLMGWIFNTLTGHRWPHVPKPAAPPPPGYAAEDLDAVLEEWDEVLDVSREDLDALFRAVERRIHQRGGQA